jgi:hypothetical protein
LQQVALVSCISTTRHRTVTWGCYLFQKCESASKQGIKDMNALAERETKREVVPSDFLSEWIRRGTLLSLIMDAAQTVEWPEPELRLAAKSGYAFRRLVLLTVVTYCYATGVYDSKEIALKIAQDEILRFLCAGTFPTLQDIRDFTNHNHELVEQSLLRTCQLAQKLGPRTGVVFPASCWRGKLGGINDRRRQDRELQFDIHRILNATSR